MIDINPTTPIIDIHRVMQTGDLWDRYVEGDAGEFDEDYVFCTDKIEWYGIEFDGETIGALKCETLSSSCIMIHPYVMEDYRLIARSVIKPICSILIPNSFTSSPPIFLATSKISALVKCPSYSLNIAFKSSRLFIFPKYKLLSK